MRAADGSGDTLGLHEKASSRGMRYLVNITNKFHVATRNTSSPTRTHTLWNKDAQRKQGTARTHGSMAHVSALGLVLLVYCSMLQQMGLEAKARATEEDRVNTTTWHACLVHTIKKSSSTTKRPCSSPPQFLVTCGADNNKSSVNTLETWWCWRPKDSLLACLRAKISRRRWTFYLAKKRVCHDQKFEFCGLRKSRSRALKKLSFSPIFIVMYTADRKHEASARWKFLVFVRA